MCLHKVAYIFGQAGEPSVYIIDDRLFDGTIGYRDERRLRIKREILYQLLALLHSGPRCPHLRMSDAR